jgi:hypothetical protein
MEADVSIDELLHNYIPRKVLAAKLGVTERTLIQWEVDRKGPPTTRIGRDVTYYWPSVEKWLRSKEVAA